MLTSITDKGYKGLPILSATSTKGMIPRTEAGIKIQHKEANEVGYKRVLKGQFVIHLGSYKSGFAYSGLGGITSPAYTVIGFTSTRENYPLFWRYVFTTERFISSLSTITYGIRQGKSIDYTELLGFTFKVPVYTEQECIGSLFSRL